MAKNTANSASVAQQLLKEMESGTFAPLYLLMGDEPYYIDKIENAILEKALNEAERDFNQLIFYGGDGIKAAEIISVARRYPVFAEKQVVVVREANQLSSLEELDVYASAPLESTVLVLVYRGSLDKRKALYKSIVKNGRVLESMRIRDYEVPQWISEYFASRSLRIDEDAAQIFAESAGVDLNKIVVETEKMLKNLPEGVKTVTAGDIEANVGVSREFSIFELTKQLSYKERTKALRTAAYIGSAAKFAMPAATAALFLHFNRILRYEALLLQSPRPSAEDKAKALAGVSPYFYREYDTAVRNYPLKSCMSVIALIMEYDFKGKGGADAGMATAQELLQELVVKILNS